MYLTEIFYSDLVMYPCMLYILALNEMSRRYQLLYVATLKLEMKMKFMYKCMLPLAMHFVIHDSNACHMKDTTFSTILQLSKSLNGQGRN